MSGSTTTSHDLGESGVTRLRSFVDAYHRQLLWGILGSALVLRILAFFSLRGSVYFDFLLWDERLYHTWAERIASGTFDSESVYEMAPLPAYFMALVYKVFSPDPVYIRLTNIVFGVLTCLLIYLIGKEMGGNVVGLVSSLVASLYGPFIFYSIVPLKTALSVLLFASLVYLLISVLNRRSWVKAVLLGICLGLVQNVRPNCLVLVPLVPLVVFWNYYGQKSAFRAIVLTCLAYVLGLAVANVPFMVRNYVVAGEPSATVTQSGFNLFMCNNLEYSYPLPFATTSPFEQGIQFTIEASRRAGKKLSPEEASTYWTREVLKAVQDRPVAYLQKLVRKVLAFFSKEERGDHYHIGFISDFVPFFKLPWIGIWLIMPFGMAGMLASLRKRKAFVSVAGVFLLYAGTLILFFSNTRVRLPLLVILIPFAVTGLSDAFSSLKERRFGRLFMYGLVVAVFFFAEFIPRASAGDLTAYYNTHAMVLGSQGAEAEAIRYWKMSSESEGHFASFANLSLAGRYSRKGDTDRAFYYLERISDDSFAAAQKYALIGDILLRKREVGKAIRAYEKSLAINSGQRGIRRQLVKIFEKVDKKRAQAELVKLRYISKFYDML